MATVITYQCVGCGTKKDVEVGKEQPVKAPVCCGRPMKEIARK